MPIALSALASRLLLLVVATTLSSSLPLLGQVGGSWERASSTSGAGAFDHHGEAVAAAGDLDADGVGDFLIGAPNLYGYSGRRASVELRSGADGSLIRRQVSVETADEFGAAVAGVGDLDGDGHADFLVGAPAAKPLGLVGAGSAWVHSGRDGQVLFRFDGDQAYASFGAAVAGPGDVDADGVPDLLIGAPDHAGLGPPSAGLVDVYSGRDGSRLHRFLGQHAWGELGAAVSGAGDQDRDGHADLLLGRPAGSVSLRGAAFLYSGASGQLLRQFSNPPGDSSLGESLAVLDDLDGDGLPELLIGDPTADTAGLNMAGSALLYSGAGPLLRRYDGPTGVAWLGQAVAAAGDVDDDGVGDFLLGAPGASVLIGAAFLHSGADGRLLRRWDGAFSGDSLGAAVAGHGAAGVMIAAPYSDLGGGTSTGSTEVWTHDPYLRPSAVRLSSSRGGLLAYQLDFPPGSGYDEYRLLASGSGTGPTDLFGLPVPLGFDRAFLLSFFGHYPAPLMVSDGHGRLDGAGRAVAYVAIPAHSFTPLVGSTVYLAAVSGPSAATPDRSSAAMPLLILP